MNKKILKIIKISMIIYIVAILMFSIIVSQNQHHLEICQKEHCSICAIIYFAQTIISLSIAFVTVAMVGVLIYFFLSRLHKEKRVFVQLSLVSQKIQLNE